MEWSGVEWDARRDYSTSSTHHQAQEPGQAGGRQLVRPRQVAEDDQGTEEAQARDADVEQLVQLIGLWWRVVAMTCGVNE